jgi:hypothetical protein
MRSIKAASWLTAAACASCAFAATPAMAGEFVASRQPKPLSETEPGKTKGVGIGSSTVGHEERSQEFKFGAFTIVCAAKTNGKTIAEGAISWNMSQVFATEVKFEKCLTKAGFANWFGGLPTRFNVNPETHKQEPVKFVYHHNGFVELGSGEVESEIEVGSGSASFTIAGKVCKVDWPSQTVPAVAVEKPEKKYSTATYSNTEVPAPETQLKKFPSGFQKRLVIANNFKGMEWSYEEGQCLGEGGFEEGAEKTEGIGATYKGTLEEEVITGNLSFVE